MMINICLIFYIIFIIVLIIILARNSFINEQRKRRVLMLSKVCYDLSPYYVIQICPSQEILNIPVLDVCCYLDFTNLEKGIMIIEKALILGIPVITTNIYAHKIEKKLNQLAKENKTYFNYNDTLVIDKIIGLINQINFYAK